MTEIAQGKAQTATGSSFSAVDLWMLLLVSIWGANLVALKFAVSNMGALSFAGLYLIICNSFSANTLTVGSQTLFGDLLMLGGALSWALYTLLSKPLLARYSSLTYTTLSMAAGAPLILLLGVPDLLQTNFAAVAPSVWVIMFFSAMLAISIGYVIWNNGVHVLGQSRTAVYSNVIPVVAFALSVLLLGEPVTAAKVVGAAVVLVGVTITRRG